MPITLLATQPPDPTLETERDLSLAELVESVELELLAGGRIAILALHPLRDATLLDLAACLHRLPGDIDLHVATPSIAARIVASLPGSGDTYETQLPGGRTLVLVEGDITAVVADAIVNASNRRLELGGGVSGAIRRRARPSLQAEMSALVGTHGLSHGHAVMTGSHGLPHARAIVHVNAVAGTEDVVRAATRAALEMAQRRGFTSLAMPLLGAGTGALSHEEAGAAMWHAMQRWSEESAAPPKRIVWVLWGDVAFNIVRSVV